MYVGSFDPPTKGHEWVIAQALKAYPNLKVAVGNNPNKKYKFSREQRVNLLRKITGLPFDSVSVLDDGMVASEYAIAKGCNTLVRGIRNSADLDFEAHLAEYYRSVTHGIQIVYVLAPLRLTQTSSSFVKTIAELGIVEPLSRHCSDFVLDALFIDQKKSVNSYVIGVTGGIGSGKSTFCEQMVSEGYAHYFNCDEYVREAYDKVSWDVLKESYPDFSEDPKELVSWLNKFSIAEGAIRLNKVNYFLYNYVREAYKKWQNDNQVWADNTKPFIFIESASLLSSGLYEQTDHIIFFSASEQLRRSRIETRGNYSEGVELAMKLQPIMEDYHKYDLNGIELTFRDNSFITHPQNDNLQLLNILLKRYFFK